MSRTDHNPERLTREDKRPSWSRNRSFASLDASRRQPSIAEDGRYSPLSGDQPSTPPPNSPPETAAGSQSEAFPFRRSPSTVSQLDRPASRRGTLAPASPASRQAAAFASRHSAGTNRERAAQTGVMSGYDTDDPPVPRSSKQAQLLGVASPAEAGPSGWEGWAITSPGSNGFLNGSSTVSQGMTEAVAPWAVADAVRSCQ